MCVFLSFDELHKVHTEKSLFNVAERIITNVLFHITCSGETLYCSPR